ncbi:histone H4 transcription factor-like isoform X2 [Liolophura sinensis]|uniref:histone H4 transcription factor-like isoform X2 n=1 Tax=Liolophura sinensis TaxID=3198878 RepID=UPI003158F0AA
MPPKKVKAKGVAVDLGDQRLRCEWGECIESFVSMQTFIKHMTNHISDYYKTWNGHQSGLFECKWRECGSHVSGQTTDFNRHVYFHAFHVKIKNVGTAVVEKSKLTPCQMDGQSRNLIPELPERLHCGWSMCEVVYDNPEYFYMHMDMHASNYPDGNHVPGGCRCQWEGCDVTVKSKYKLREHLRSHTQEKMIACPVCGALFASRTKFLDHLRRQGSVEVQCYECSHCNKRFTSERLLRDHMRHHVNHYKCPYCDMTCPTPSGLRNHLRYRHTEDRPYKCDQCDYSCKSSHDLRKHIDTHTVMKTFQCHMTACKFQTRSYQSLSHHFTKEHQGLEPARYACHVCNSVFTRGHHLTLHLKRLHKFKWPSGHSRFRYKPNEDGFLRLQTVRYESVELMDQMVNDSSSSSSANQPEQNQENVAPAQKTDSSSNVQQQALATDHLTSNMATASDTYKSVSSESTDTDNMAYNLQMLGDVALHGPSSTTKTYQMILPRPEISQPNSDEPLCQGTSQVTLQEASQQIMKSTSQVSVSNLSSTQAAVHCHVVPNLVSISQTDCNQEAGTPHIITLEHMDHSPEGGEVYTFSAPGPGQSVCYHVPSQFVPEGNQSRGFVLCSASMEVVSEESGRDGTEGAEDEGMEGGEADIFRLQKSKSRDSRRTPVQSLGTSR